MVEEQGALRMPLCNQLPSTQTRDPEREQSSPRRFRTGHVDFEGSFRQTKGDDK